MIQKLIANKIKSLTKEDLKQLAHDNNITLNNDEINYLYQKIKNDWYDFIYKNPNPILKDIEKHINKDSFNKLLTLYNYYKIKYQNYL